MTFKEAITKIEDAIKKKEWGTAEQTQEVLEEMLYRLVDPETYCIDEDELSDAFLRDYFDECLNDLREGAFQSVSNIFIK